jgi:hypothetical protein
LKGAAMDRRNRLIPLLVLLIMMAIATYVPLPA